MRPRDVFDMVLVVLVSIVLYIEFYGTTTSGAGAIKEIADALVNIDPMYYLIVGGVFGVIFVSYITIYLPQKHSQNP
ncbi:hypothetical protein ACFQJ7_09575 [Halovenus rubra]|uniref:Uncharacterized protein n=2 Tax=Halovenus rubra TaxID=869890 RepID=A0ACC7DX07_9EURY|nr:hypothetical protein [Halovenus rubra]